MRKLFTNFLICFSLVLSLLLPGAARADHMVGSDISWQCTGDSIIIKVADYRDCNGIPFVNTPIDMTSKCDGTDKSVSGTSSGGRDITPVCKKSCTRCSDGGCEFPYGIQQYYITCKISKKDLKSCCNWTISWNQCCRSADISTGATWAGYYIESYLDICTTGGCDNSPTFLNPPVAVYCTNQCITYNPGTDDIDRAGYGGTPDSLVFKLTTPLQPGSKPGDGGTSVPWTGGFSYNQPLKFDGFGDPNGTWNPPKSCKGFHMDPETGDLEFKATAPDVTVIAEAVEEWRKDSTGKYVKIGEIRRDLQIIIINCPANNPPIVSGIDGTNQVTKDFCAGQTKCFKIQAFDMDQNDSVTMTWDHSIPGADFEILDKTKKWPTGQFCWTPPKSAVRTYPYRFTVTAQDNACPIPGRSNKTFTLTVNNSPQANYSANLSGCGKVNFIATNTRLTNIVKYVWSGQGSPGYGPLFSQSSTASYQYNKPGTYQYSLTVTSDKGCTTTYIDSIKIPNYVQVTSIRDTTVCVGSSITIPATVTTPFKPDPYHLTWSTGSADYDKPSITATITKDTVFVVTVQDKNCTNYDSVKVHGKPLPKPLLAQDTRSCAGEIVWLKTLNTKKDPTMQGTAYKQWFKYAANGSKINLGVSDSFPVKDSGKYSVTVVDSFGCSGSDDANVYFNPLVKVYKQIIDGCQGDSILINAGTGGTSYVWYDLHHPNKPMPNTGPTLKAAVNNSGGSIYQVTASRTMNGLTCTSTDTIWIRYHAKPKVTGGKLPPQCIDASPLNLSAFGTPKGGTWTNWNPKSNKPNLNPYAVVNNVLYPKVMDTGSHRMFYTYKDNYGCINTDSTGIEIDTIPHPEFDPMYICREKGKLFLQGLEPLGMTGGHWEYYLPGVAPNQQTPDYGIVHIFNPAKGYDSVFFDPDKVGDITHYLKYTYTNPSSAKCSGSGTLQVTVGSIPKASAGSYGPYCQSDGTVYFDKATRKSNVEWLSVDAPTGSFTQSSGVGMFDVTKAPKGGTFRFVYIAYADAQKHCPYIDTFSVQVLPADSISFDTKDGNSGYCETVDNVPLIATVNGKSNWTAGITYSGSGIAPGNNRFYPGLAQAGPNTITMTYRNASGCTSTTTKVITVYKKPKITAASPTASCASADGNYTFSVHVENADVIEWKTVGPFKGDYPQGNSSETIIYHPNPQEVQRGILHLIVKVWNSEGLKNNGCGMDSLDVIDTLYQTPVVTVSNNDKGCAPLTVHFRNDQTIFKQNKGLLSYHWDFGDGESSNQTEPLHVYKKAAPDGKPYTVTLTVTNEHGCSGSAQGQITVFANPQIAISAVPRFTTIAEPKVTFNIDKAHSTGIGSKMSYQWYFGDWNDLQDEGSAYGEQVDHKYSDTGKYTVKVIAVNLESTCTDTLVEEAYVDIRPEIMAFIPNVFTPNGKYNQHTKVNEKFSVVLSSYSSFEMTVFNRWGQQVYHTTDINDGWDGNYNNQPAEEGVYVYVVKARSDSGKEYKFTGTVTLLR